MASSPSISTVYVQNLEERVKIPQLSGLLRTLFSEFGTVVDIVAKKNLKSKGQAFIVYDDPANAKSAIDELQGFKLFDKPMRLSLAKSRSDKSVEIASSSETNALLQKQQTMNGDLNKATGKWKVAD
ncbi:related to small nuclear ribonucleoprotein snRNP U1A [Claviceps purpurea 20.1]|uniref:Related to small nuclear ribonucleoprotein snRNP U1A n=1 Tax=Claviceps purpurea (strain 20.1) TaxID=1111077 RepID=M1VYS2_CLAP2|nr:related to small nuclear ribonucleoprotein snRNP U1A [Claviceps purpurea 20.1]